MLSFGVLAKGQESVRPSLTGSTAAAARQVSAQQPNYNLKAGPVTFDLRGDLGIEYNDNINLAEKGAESDFLFRPMVTLNSYWQVTKLNALSFDIGIGYTKYLDHDDQDTNAVLISPNSKISFDIFIGDFKINLHDRFSISEDPIDEGTLSNTSDFTRFENSAGVTVLWDLNDVKLVFGYDLYTFKALTGSFDFLDRLEHQFTGSAAFQLADGFVAGVDAGFTVVDYDQSFNNDATSTQVGPFAEYQLTNYLKIRLEAGYQSMNFDGGGTNQDSGDASTPYVVATLTNRLNSKISQELTGGYESRLGLTTNFVKVGFARYSAGWQISRLFQVKVDGFYENLQESDGLSPEESWRVGGGINLDCQVTKKASAGVRYEFTKKDSDLAGRDYEQNRVLFRVGYDF